MPTRDVFQSFLDDWKKLTPEQQRRLLSQLKEFKEDLDRGGPIRGSLRVHPMRGYPGIWEMTWDGNDGRATFHFGPEQKPGKRHIVWRRIGGHEIYDNP